jgi:hypothetical protein
VTRPLLLLPPVLAGALSVGLAALGIAGCSGCLIPPIAGPSDAGALPSATSARACVPAGPSKGFVEQLVVDWPSEQRDALAAELRDGAGLATVRFDGCSAELVPSCRAPGSYQLTRNQPTEASQRRLYGPGELAERYPMSAELVALAGDAAPVSLDLWTLGTYDADLTNAPAIAASGGCARATHVVVSASIGLFVVGPAAAPSQPGIAGDRCLSAPSASGKATPIAECARPLSLILAPLPGASIPTAPACPARQVRRGEGCVPDVPALASGSPGAERAGTLLQRLETAKGAERAELLLALAELYDRSEMDPASAEAIGTILRPFLDDLALRAHPKLLDALLLFRRAFLAVARLDEVLAASSILVKQFPDDPRVAPAYLDLARHYCKEDADTADSVIAEIQRRFARDKANQGIVLEALKLRGTCKPKPKSAPKPANTPAPKSAPKPANTPAPKSTPTP